MRVLDVVAEQAPDDKAPGTRPSARAARWSSWSRSRPTTPACGSATTAEDVHKARVATRRARAVIRATRPLLGEALTPLADELKWLGGALGSVRDLDVLLEHLRPEVATLGDDREAGAAIVAVLEEEREAARDALLTDLDSRAVHQAARRLRDGDRLAAGARRARRCDADRGRRARPLAQGR